MDWKLRVVKYGIVLWFMVMMGVMGGTSAGLAAGSPDDATLDVSERVASLRENITANISEAPRDRERTLEAQITDRLIPGDGPLIPDYGQRDAIRSTLTTAVKWFAHIMVTVLVTVAFTAWNHAARFAYYNDAWLARWWLQPVLTLWAIGPPLGIAGLFIRRNWDAVTEVITAWW